MSTQTDTYQFQAETRQLLDLVVHSLYTKKEIFLRELISNASDALDHLRFEALLKPELMDGPRLEIRIEADPANRTLTVSDNGIGMTREEVIANIGTIAKSGTRELREKLKEGTSAEALEKLIGQFGVGFYSAFMVADRISLVTRRAGEREATRWESSGDGEFTLSSDSKPACGTSITLHLKPVESDSGLEDYTDKWVLGRIIKRHSDFITYPIVYRDQREEATPAAEGEAQAGEGDGPKTIVVEDKILNSMQPIWTRPPAEVKQEEYAEFYQNFFHEAEAPLKIVSARAEGLLEYQALLFVPAKAPYDLFYQAFEPDLRLYAKGVLIMERCAELLPRYLRFLKGLVDSADLPLNISRQMLQQERQLTLIQKWLTKKALDAIQNLREQEPEQYLKFWEQFGRALKEGLSSDFENRERLTPLLLLDSSHDPQRLTTLKEYVERMKEDQAEIFYLTGESRAMIENSPHLEAFREKGYEVLYLSDPVDELLVQYLTEFEGRKLKSVVKGTVRLGNEEEQARTEKELQAKAEESADLLQSLQKHLDAHVKDVRLTNRLTSSPVCLVGSEMDYSPQMERLLQFGAGGRPKQRRIMELNPEHPIYLRLRDSYRKSGNDELLKQYAELLLGYGLLSEGTPLHDPVAFNHAVAELMERSLSATD
ncbi:MAG TPA: molecular chaperone HtpG [Pyrinomonadaceae bacterium]|jgi:molecular chaperone HtpG